MKLSAHMSVSSDNIMLFELVLSLSCRPPLTHCFYSETTAGWVCVTVPQSAPPPPTPSFPSVTSQCLDGTAFTIIYRAFKSLMSWAVCKSPVSLWAEQLTW